MNDLIHIAIGAIIATFATILMKYHFEYKKMIKENQEAHEIDYKKAKKVLELKAKYINDKDIYCRNQQDKKHDKNDWLEVKKELQNKRVLSQ